MFSTKIVTEDRLDYLRQVSKDYSFETNTEEQTKQLSQHIKALVRKEHAFGISGIQFEYPYRVFGIYISEEKFEVMYNPKLLNIIDKTPVAELEGCLSFPQLILNKKRPKQISVEYQDETGQLNNTELFDYYARGFLHELDHLNGVVFTDHVSPIVLKMARKRRYKRQKN